MALERPQPEKIHNKEIESLEKPLLKILEKVAYTRWDLIIGDDASGRIPALVVSEFLKTIARLKKERGPKVVFIAGGTKDIFGKHLEDVKRAKKENIKEFLEKQRGLMGKTGKEMLVLVVTDTISHGQTLEPLSEALRELGSFFLIATVALTHPENKSELEKKLKTHIFYGEERIPEIWQKYNLAGVARKEDAKEIHSRPIKRPRYQEETKKEIQKNINLSRQDVNILVERLVKKFDKSLFVQR